MAAGAYPNRPRSITDNAAALEPAVAQLPGFPLPNAAS